MVGLDRDSNIFVAGGGGLVGSALLRALTGEKFANVIAPTRAELDLEDQRQVREFFQARKPTHVFMAAAKVGGILANSKYPADFIRANLAIELNVIDAAYQSGVTKLAMLGSSCIYPRLASQPIAETELLTGPLEATNESYAIAKIAGIKLCQAYNTQFGTNYISLMPTNLYGPGDNFDLETSHVLPALVRRFHEAKASGSPVVTVWGSGRPQREFLHVDDMASACVHLMKSYDSSDIINVGTGSDVSIDELTRIVARVVGYGGRIEFDASKPDGTPRKLLDVSRLSATGWKPRIPLREGIAQTYAWYLDHVAGARGTVREYDTAS
ncbi:MAG TPA: GDP-L-fucose synthase [Gemmatimonadaceae bacterium]|nr:GDP-L-fucose synthase [Gemmatimonadaceae bacterium]